MNMIPRTPDKAHPKSKTPRATPGKPKPPAHPPDKGGLGGFIPYDKALTDKARENRKNPTPAEKRLWLEVLQNKRLGTFKFIRQKPVDHYIVDFYCSELMLAIEIDGDTHAERQQYDATRTQRLNKLGIEVFRYPNTEILNNLEGVYEDLLKRVAERTTLDPDSSHEP
ncbi:MAG: DUF559 domain-containing protein [Nitrospira sp.]|nr:DUF559 domain-containing protein [Nitrospira sp.]